MRDSGRIFKYGDCSSCTASACFSVPSKTESPVVLTKSGSSTLSFSLSLADFPEPKKMCHARNSASTTATAGMSIFEIFLRPDEGAPAEGLRAEGTGVGGVSVDEAATAVCDVADDAAVAWDEADPGGGTVAAAGGVSSAATGTEPELCATARPLSVSRFSRCRSARMSAALW